MSELGFKQIKFGVVLTFFSENGKIDEYDVIEDEIKDSLDTVFSNIVDSYNNAIKHELIDGVEIANGSDTNK